VCCRESMVGNRLSGCWLSWSGMVALQGDKQAGLTASTCLRAVSLPRLQIPSDLTATELDRATRRVLRARVRCASLLGSTADCLMR